jgi:hypothetical protein
MSDLTIPEPQIPPEVPPDQPAPAKKPYRWVITVLVILLALTCLCAGVAAVLVIKSISQMPADMRSVESLIDKFMVAGTQQDSQAAFALFSGRGQQQMPLSEIEKLFQNDNRALFSGYQSLTTTSYNFHTGPGADQDSDQPLPAGTFAVLRGTLNYQGGVTGTFNAVLEQVGSDWKLYHIDIGVPPSKFRDNRSG